VGFTGKIGEYMKDLNLVGNAKEAIDFLGNHYTFNCMGCAMINHEIIPPGGFIYETNSFYLIQDPEVPIKGFLIINSKKHLKSITEFTKEERMELIELTNIAIKALKDLGITDEVTIIREERSFHFHLWIFPTHTWMNKKFGKGITYIRDIFSYAIDNASKKDIEETLRTIKIVRDYVNKVNQAI